MKEKFISILAIAFFVVTSVFAGHIPTCTTQFSGTDFSAKPGVTSEVYSIDEVLFFDPSSERLSLSATFNKSKNLKAGEYYIDKKGLHICVETADGFDILKYNISNLAPEIGDYYRVSVDFTTENTPGTSGYNRQLGFHTTYLEDGNVRDDNPYWQLSASGVPQKDTYSVPYTIDFKTKDSQLAGYTILQTANMQSDNKSMVLLIKSIKVTGCYNERIIIENGTNCCKGEENVFTLKTSQTYSSYKWEYSSDNKATWKTIPGNTKSVKTTINDDKIYIRVTYGGKTLEAGPISSVICCSADGTKQDIIKEDFTFKDPSSKGAGSNSGRLEFFGNFFDGKVTTDYENPEGLHGGYLINAGQCAVVDRADAGGWWVEKPILTGHTENGKDDGFLLVNCGLEHNVILEYEMPALPYKNADYEFSAWIANVNVLNPNRAPINVKLVVSGENDGGETKTLLSMESGDLMGGGMTPWTLLRGSFNSEDCTKVSVKLINNLDPEIIYVAKDDQGRFVDVHGNDLAIDDVRLTVCVPYSESQVYADCPDAEIIFREDFTYEVTGYVNCHSQSLSSFKDGHIEAEYYDAGGDCNIVFPVDENMCAVTDDSDIALYWAGHGVVGTTHNAETSFNSEGYNYLYRNDGFLIVNCDIAPNKIFGYTIDSIEKNTDCRFSANICNLFGVGDEYVADGRVMFVVKGKESEKVYVEQEFDIPKGDFTQKDSYGNPDVWKKYFVDFTTGEEDTGYIVELYNAISDEAVKKYKSVDGKGINGNDIAIDDIVVAACSSEVETNAPEKEEDETLKNYKYFKNGRLIIVVDGKKNDILGRKQ